MIDARQNTHLVEHLEAANDFGLDRVQLAKQDEADRAEEAEQLDLCVPHISHKDNQNSHQKPPVAKQRELPATQLLLVV